MTPNFFKIRPHLFVNLNLITSVWWEESTKFECLYICLAGDSEGARIEVNDSEIIIDLLSKLNIEFDHIFYKAN